MKKTFNIDGRSITFKSTAITPLLYKSQFAGKDLFQDIMNMNKASKNQNHKRRNNEIDIENLDIEIFYNIIWICAKTNDRNIKDKIEWFSEFDEFPIFDIAKDLMEMIMRTMQTKKK